MENIEKDLTKDEKEEAKLVNEDFPVKKHSEKEVTSDEKAEESFSKLAKTRKSDTPEETDEPDTAVYKLRKIKKHNIAFVAVVLLVFAALLFVFMNLDKDSEIAITVIKDKSCSFCTDVGLIINEINKSKDVAISAFEEYDYKDEAAKALLSSTGVKTVPAIIIKGNSFTKTEIFKNLSSKDFEQQADVFVLSNFLPPITNIENNQVLGLVDVIYLKDERCVQCADLNYMINRFKGLGVYVNTVREIDISSKEGADLKSRYVITKVPTLVFDPDLELYQHIAGSWSTYGTVESDGMMILRTLLPPYNDLAAGKIKGMIKVTYIVDQSCSSCYDPRIHKDAIARIMPHYDGETTFDVSSLKGKELVAKYGIADVPTIILSEDVNEYPLFESLFGNVFEKQKDGCFVFKDNPGLKAVIYKDLKTGKEIAS